MDSISEIEWVFVLVSRVWLFGLVDLKSEKLTRYGGSPSIISMAMIPKDQMSTFGP